MFGSRSYTWASTVYQICISGRIIMQGYKYMLSVNG